MIRDRFQFVLALDESPGRLLQSYFQFVVPVHQLLPGQSTFRGAGRRLFGPAR